VTAIRIMATVTAIRITATVITTLTTRTGVETQSLAGRRPSGSVAAANGYWGGGGMIALEPPHERLPGPTLAIFPGERQGLVQLISDRVNLRQGSRCGLTT